jgi:monoamine oxidase
MKSQNYKNLARFAGIQTEIRSRREWIRTAASLACATALLGPNTNLLANTEKKKRVVVIGAGFAGAACAYELHESGYDVVIVEASGEVGGRVKTARDWIDGVAVELGAELIGSNHPTWVHYAQKFGLELEPIESDETAIVPVRMNGMLLSKDEAKKLYMEMDEIHAILAKAAESVDWQQPWDTAGAKEIDNTTFAKYLNSLEGTDQAKRAVAAEFNHDLAVAPERMSTLGVLAIISAHGHLGYWDNSEAYRCKSGGQRLPELLLKPLAERLKLGNAVSRIVQSQHNAQVTLANGDVIECDEVVLAIPPTVWHKIDISPALPKELSVQMGSAVKYVAMASKPIWASQPAGIDYFGDDHLGMTWESHRGHGSGASIVASFAGGTFADAALTIPAINRATNYREAFDALLPGFANVVVRDEFVDHVGNPWIRGGYSCPAPGQVTTAWKALQEPIGRIHLAGEHTALGFTGFMEGALQSGVRVARRVAGVENN